MNQHIDTAHAKFPGSLSKHRLADISHLFLSDEAERLSQWRNTLIMPVLLMSKNDDHVVYDLEQAISRHGRTCLVLNIESQLGPEGLAAKHAREIDADEATAPDVCLIPLTSGGTTRVLNSDRLLLAVPTSLPGVRLAYNQLAALASYGLDLQVQVAMLDASDPKEAQRFFKFLSNSARNLLGMDIQCGGYVTRRRGAERTAASSTAHAIPQGMDEIAKAILSTKTPRQSHSLPSASRPKLADARNHSTETTTGLAYPLI